MVVVMISAAEWGDIEAKARAAGVDDFISKPLFPSSVVDCINEYLGVVDDVKSKHVSLDGVFAGNRILLAEDIEINREIVMSLLEETAIAIDCVENGKRAVEVFERSSDRYDLIFMDINMPEMSGYQATRIIRALPMLRAREIPIVAMTANVFREDVNRCLSAGMNDHIGKPVDLDNILSKLFKYLKNEVYKPQR
jgi:CheY-like chemotaxis protein